jgi:lysophospholipase L1-like esterase
MPLRWPERSGNHQILEESSMEKQQKQGNQVDAQKLDPNMAVEESRDDGLKWLSPKEEPFRLSGFAWFAKERIYRRLPLHPQHPIRPEVDRLADATAGGQIAFRTNSLRLSLRVTLGGKANMNHMPATGQCSFDCYLGEPGDQQYYSTGRYDHALLAYETALYQFPERTMRHVTLNFPLYQKVEEVWIGVDADAELLPPLPYASGKKVVVYGTSITQGGCASRPGMAYTNILSRRFPLEFVNLGFSGNGKGEPEVARIISEIEQPALFVLDYEANIGGDREAMRRTLPEFIRILRERHPAVPILVVSKIRYARELFEPRLKQMRLDLKQVEIETVESFRRQGDLNVHFFDGETLLGENFNECSVDGVHPTDLGFLRMADGLTPVIAKLLAGEI